MQPKRKRKQFIICFVDILLLCISLYVSQSIRILDLLSLEEYVNILQVFVPIFFVWICVQYIEGLYSLENSYIHITSTLKIGIAGTICLFLGFAWFYLFPYLGYTPKSTLAFFCFISFLFVNAWRYFFNVLFFKVSKQNNIGVIGISQTLDELIEHSSQFSYMGYSITAIFSQVEQKTYKNIPVYNNLDNFVALIKEKNITQIVLIQQNDLPIQIQKELFTLLQHNITFISIAQFYEIYIRKIPINEINALWFLKNFHLHDQKAYIFFKRFFDIVFSLTAFIILLPFFPIIALSIKLDSKGTIFFTQVRTGFLGNDFLLYKFRTMTASGNTFKPTEKNDSRITRVGDFMRKTRIDELPQLINVIKGDMSLIGPRPERPELIVELEEQIPFYKQRLLVKPGITGWDQVSGEYHSPSVEDTYKKLQYDLYYIKNMSLFLDMSIFAKTVKTVFIKAGR